MSTDTKQKTPVGWCLCAVKNTNEDDPFWVGYVPITKRRGTKYWFVKPYFLNRPKPSGPSSYHFKLLPDFYVDGPDEPNAIEGRFPKGALDD